MRKILSAGVILLAGLINLTPLQGGKLYFSFAENGDNFGSAVAISGNNAYIGAYLDEPVFLEVSNSGNSYFFQDIFSAVPSEKEVFASDLADSEYFGGAVGLSGNIAVVGAYTRNNSAGAAYVFANLHTANPTQYSLIPATPLDASDGFGRHVAISGSTALVAARGDDDAANGAGAAYVFVNANTAAPTIYKLTAFDAQPNDAFGSSVSISGSIALVGAQSEDEKANNAGAAYVFVNADTATPTQYKLMASDGAATNNFGWSVGMSGTTALVGARAHNNGAGLNSGAAYVFVNANTATPTEYKLVASDTAANDFFGNSVAISGSTALVGALVADNETGADTGSAYLFLNADTATPTEIRVIPSKPSNAASMGFSASVAIDGDNFIVGANSAGASASGEGNEGAAYTGTVSSMSTLNTGNTSHVIDEISFRTKGDWIVGDTTDSNSVTLSSGDTGNVTALGKMVFIGKLMGADNNELKIAGGLTATVVNIGQQAGAVAGNTGNVLRFENGADFTIDDIFLAGGGNKLAIFGDYTNSGNLFGYLDSTDLNVWSNGAWTEVNAGNFSSLVTATSSGGYTYIEAVSAVPEPSRMVLLVLGVVGFVMRRKRVGRC